MWCFEADPGSTGRTGQWSLKSILWGVAKAVATAVCIASKKIAWQGVFGPASCAKVTNRRIGEASHPGPPRAPRRVRLEDINLVEAKTAKLQLSVWRRFQDWLLEDMSCAAIESLFLCPSLLVKVAGEFGNFLYETNQSLYVYRHFVVYLQRLHPEVKPVDLRMLGYHSQMGNCRANSS